jgi:hypothetical protein
MTTAIRPLIVAMATGRAVPGGRAASVRFTGSIVWGEVMVSTVL